MVPNGWDKTRLKHIARIKSGSTPLRAKQDVYYSIDGTPWVKTLDLNNSEIIKTDERITELALKETSCSIFPVNTVLVAMYGGFNQIGRTGLLTVPSAINQALSGLILDSKKAEPKYILNYLNGNVRQWKKFAASSRKDPNITREDVCGFEVLLPPLPEQQKIAKILSTWDKAIATTEKLIATSQQQKKALMQQLLTGKKRVLNPETGKMFEGDWEEVKLGDLSSKITKGTTPSTNGFQFHEHGINFVKVESILKSGQFDLSKFAYIDDECHSAFKRSQLEKGDILFSIAGALGRTAMVTSDILPANTNQALSIVRLKKSSRCAEFIIQYLNCSAIAATIKGLTAQAAQPNLSLKDVGNLPIKLPTLKEQQKIASVLTAADKEIELLQAKLVHLKEEKKALMQQLLAGKHRVKVDLDMEIAS
ncbi:restriction endonuclease subunit S [Vibrio fluvialis]|nr:restriction endonuclease subunit S [Vibrio fluvialis]MCG6341259.1 restriction endonuclease subunit S [Vibrio fluvialis]